METKWTNNSPMEPDPYWTYKKDGEFSSLEVMLLSDIHTWKSVRQVIIKITLELFLKDYDNKLVLAQNFAKHYKRIYLNVEKDDHDYKYSTSSITVQLFTVPTVTRYLIAHHDIITPIAETLFDRFFPVNDANVREMRELNRGTAHKNMGAATSDIEYILGNVPANRVELEPLQEAFKKGIVWFLEMLRLFQIGDGITWHPRTHVEKESDWEKSITFIMRIQTVFKRMMEWAQLDDELMLFVITHVKMLLDKRPISTIPFHLQEKYKTDEYAHLSAADTPKDDDVLVWGKYYKIINVDINTKKVSVYCQLSRVITTLLGQITIDSKLKPHEITFYCMDSLVALSLAAQIRAGFWRRNGQSTMYIMYYYTHEHCRQLMSNLDQKVYEVKIVKSQLTKHFFSVLKKM